MMVKNTHWIYNEDTFTCPTCGFETGNPNYYDSQCPQCGFRDEKDNSGDEPTAHPDYEVEYHRLLEENRDLRVYIEGREDYCRMIENENKVLQAQLEIVRLIFGR